MSNSIKRGPVILFEGSDFSGKTTVISSLYKDCKNTVLLKEPNSQLSLLITDNEKINKLFNSNDNKYLRELGRYSLLTASRISTYIEVCNNIKAENMVLLDRSFPSSMVYQKIINKNILYDSLGMINDITFNILGEQIIIPDLIIFLEISLETYLYRMKNRGLCNSMDETDLSKISDILSSYDEVFCEILSSGSYKKNIIKIDANKNCSNTVITIVKDFLSNFKLGNGKSWLKDNQR